LRPIRTAGRQIRRRSHHGAQSDLGELGDVLDSGIAQAAFDAADVGGIEVGAFGEFFLRELFRLADAADVQSKSEEDSIAFRHD
jgi:hypothetical protein